MKRNEEQQKVIDKIVRLLDESFEQNDLLMTRDKNFHVSIAVLDLLRLMVPNDIIDNGGDRFVDVIYKLSGSEILGRVLNNERSKLDKIHADVIYEGEKNGN